MTTRAYTILLVEEDADLARQAIDALASRGHLVVHAGDAASAEACTAGAWPDLLVLGLKSATDLETCAAWRMWAPGVPFIVCVTASPEERARVLRMGADDVMDRPYDLDELEARVEAVLRPPVGLEAADAGGWLMPAKPLVRAPRQRVWRTRTGIPLVLVSVRDDVQREPLDGARDARLRAISSA